MHRIEVRAAEAAVHVVRDEAGLLPLSPDVRTLLVEEVSRMYLYANDTYIHPGIFWERILPHSDNVSLLEIEENPTEEDMDRLDSYIPFYDVFICTYYQTRSSLGAARAIERLLDAGKKVVVVSTTPLPYSVPAHWPTVICTYGVFPAVLGCAADLLFGKFTPQRPARSAPWDQ